MERACFIFEIYPDKKEEYQRRHDEIWPELVQVIIDSGMKNYSIFRRDTLIIVYAECHPNTHAAFAKANASEVTARWSDWFQDVIVEMDGGDGDLELAEEVWHLD